MTLTPWGASAQQGTAPAGPAAAGQDQSPPASGPAIGVNSGVQPQHGGRVIRGGVVVCYRPPNRAAVTNMGVTDTFSERGQRGNCLPHYARASNVSVTRHSSNKNVIIFGSNTVEFINAHEVDKVSGRG